MKQVKIIGQKNLISKIDKLITQKKFPRFFIINGEKGSGRHTVINYIADKLGVDAVSMKSTLEDMRNCIKYIQTSQSEVLFFFDNVDSEFIDLSPFLSTVEQLPIGKSVAIITAFKQGLPDTIKSRAFDFDIDPYTTEELKNFCTDEEKLEVLRVPGKLLCNKNFNEVMQTCKDILRKIDKVSLGNALLKLQKAMQDNFSLHLDCLSYLISKNHDDIDRCIRTSNLITEARKYLLCFQAKESLMVKEFIIKLWSLYNEDTAV